MSHSLNSLKGDIKGIIQGTTIGLIKGDTRSLDNGSYPKKLASPKSELRPRVYGN